VVNSFINTHRHDESLCFHVEEAFVHLNSAAVVRPSTSWPSALRENGFIEEDQSNIIGKAFRNILINFLQQ